MALCFKMILINQLHNQNALVSLSSLLFHGSQLSSEAGAGAWWEGMARTGGEAQPWRGSVQTPVHVRATTALAMSPLSEQRT